MVDFGLINRCKKFAEKCMKEIDYDNNMVNRYNPEHIMESWKSWIAKMSMNFIKNYPTHDISDEDINLICCGDYNEILNKYGSTEGWDDLNLALNEYHDPTCTNRVKYPIEMLRSRLSYYIAERGGGKKLVGFKQSDYNNYIIAEDEDEGYPVVFVDEIGHEHE